MSTSPPLLLASTSSYRRTLLARLGLPFDVAAPTYVEHHDIAPARELARLHAQGKARSLATAWPDHLIIGSDQVVIAADAIMHKPGTPERALAQLQRMRDHGAELRTHVVLLQPSTGRVEEHLDLHHLHLRALSDAQLRRYVELDRPLDCSGSFKLEGLGISLFERIDGGDHTGVIGLPLMAICRLLERFGIAVPPT